MKILRFKKLKLQNFLSVGNTPLEFDFLEGLNLITGYNRDAPDEKNGIGKSSICDGLFFALFNETIKDLKMAEIVNDKNCKKCIVELQFSIEENGRVDDYVITRKLKPSDVEFTKNGAEDEALSTIPITNKEIARVLGISKDLFKQSIILSIGHSVSFFAQGKSEKRKFIEGIFNLEIFSDMLSEARTGYNDTKKEKDLLHSQLNNEKARLTQYSEKDTTFETNREEFIELIKSQMRKDISKIKELTETLKDEHSTDELLTSLSGITERLEKVDALNLTVEVKLSELSRDISKLTSDINNFTDSCLSCNRIFDDVTERERIKKERMQKVKDLTSERVDFANKKSKIVSKKNEIGKERDAVRIEMASMKAIAESNRTIRSHMTTLKNSNEQNKQKIISKRGEISDFSDLILKSNETIASLSEEYNEVFKQHKVFDACKFILSEEGVKSVIIKQLKALLNRKLNEYLDLLGSSVTCEFDEYFVETIYNKNGKEKSYGAFSGGESKRIDLAILLTFQDILKDQSGMDIKLGFYDEVLDSSICASGLKRLLKLLKERSEETPTYVISHRGKMSDLIDNEIVLEKHNDFTYLKEIK
jgi:DNA repair exonuclease SbcCD ATPase subunit